MSILGAFTGSTARRAARNAMETNQRELRAGYDANRGYAQTAYQTAQGRFSPYEGQGRQAYQTYGNLLGLGGQPAQQAAMQGYQASNPYLAADQGRALQAVDRRAAATGQFDTGMNALARARVVDEMGSRDFQDYLNRLQALGGTGLGIAGTLAGLDTGNADRMMGIENMFRSGNMSNMTNYFNANAAASQAGAQNILGLVGALGSAFIPGAGGASAAGNMLGGLRGMFGGANNVGPWTTTVQRGF